MRVSDEVSRQLNAHNQSLLLTLEQTRGFLKIPKGEWAAQYLALSEKEYLKLLARNKPLGMDSLYRVAERLDLNIDDFQRGEIELEALAERQRGNHLFVHPRYTVAAKSKKHTVLNALKFVEADRGPHLREEVNRHFQIHEGYWKTGLQDPINVRFLTDLWSFLKRRGVKDEDFKRIGMNSVNLLRNTELEKKLSAECKSVKEVFEYVTVDLIRKFDENQQYRLLSLDDDRCVVESVSHPDVAEALRVKHLGSPEGCLVRVGVTVSLPAFIGGRPASVHETHCVHRGDPSCRFLVDYSASRVRRNGSRLTLIRSQQA